MTKKLVDQPTIAAIYDEVRKVNERLSVIEKVIEEIIIVGLPNVELNEEEMREIRSSIEEMKRGDCVTLEALEGA